MNHESLILGLCITEKMRLMPPPAAFSMGVLHQMIERRPLGVGLPLVPPGTCRSTQIVFSSMADVSFFFIFSPLDFQSCSRLVSSHSLSPLCCIQACFCQSGDQCSLESGCCKAIGPKAGGDEPGPRKMLWASAVPSGSFHPTQVVKWHLSGLLRAGCPRRPLPPS